MSMKDIFMVEIDKIEDVVLRDIAKRMVKDIPEYFWTIPASSSGKYHPECDLGTGGLVRHSIMVCRVAIDLIRSEVFIKDNQVNRDIARIATLFHDCIKSGHIKEDGTYSEHTVFEHPNLASEFVQEYLDAGGVDDIKKMMICDAIKTHMGKWCTSKYSSIILDIPKTDFEKLIHIADYMASRKYIGGLNEWKENE